MTTGYFSKDLYWARTHAMLLGSSMEEWRWSANYEHATSACPDCGASVAGVKKFLNGKHHRSTFLCTNALCSWVSGSPPPRRVDN